MALLDTLKKWLGRAEEPAGGLGRPVAHEHTHPDGTTHVHEHAHEAGAEQQHTHEHAD